MFWKSHWILQLLVWLLEWGPLVLQEQLRVERLREHVPGDVEMLVRLFRPL